MRTEIMQQFCTAPSVINERQQKYIEIFFNKKIELKKIPNSRARWHRKIAKSVLPIVIITIFLYLYN